MLHLNDHDARVTSVHDAVASLSFPVMTHSPHCVVSLQVLILCTIVVDNDCKRIVRIMHVKLKPMLCCAREQTHDFPGKFSR